MSSVDALKTKQFFNELNLDLNIDEKLFENLRAYINYGYICYENKYNSNNVFVSQHPRMDCDECIFHKISTNKFYTTVMCYLDLEKSIYLNNHGDLEGWCKMKRNIVDKIYNHYKVFFEEDNNE